MPSPFIIQDSDDERALSPEKLPQLELSPYDSFFDGVGDGVRTSLVNKVAARHASSHGTTYTSASPSGNSTRTVATGVQEYDTAGTISFGNTSLSPTLSNMKRARTTMEKVEKKPKTYGSKTTLDDLGLGQSVYEKRWERIFDGDESDFVDERERKKKKKRHQQDDESPIQGDVFAQFATKPSTSSSRNATVKLDGTTTTGNTMGPGEGRTATDPLEPIEPPNDAISPITDPASQNENAMIQNEPNCNDIESGPIVVVESKTTGTAIRDTSKQRQEKVAKVDSVDEAKSQKQPKLSENHNKRKRWKHGESSERETFDPWEDDPDLPQERYKPRRSRLRGGEDEVDELMETIDFSKRPEVVAKKKTRLNRRKTTGGAIVVHVDNKEDSPFGVIEEPPFEPSKSRVSKTPVPTIELDGDDDDFTEPAPPEKKTKKKRGRPKKSDTIEATSEIGIPASEERKSPGHQPELKGRKGKKKDRQATPPVASTEGDNDTDEGESIFVQGEQESLNRKPALDVEVRIEQPPSTPSPKKAIAEPLTDKTNSISASESVELPGKNQGAKTSKEEEKSPKKHSPLSDSVVRYRVGLSKRARIEPLLRIMRK